MKTIPGKFKKALLGVYVLFAAMLTIQACEVTEAEFNEPEVFDIEVYQRMLADTYETAVHNYATQEMSLQDAMQLSLQEHLGTDAYNGEFLSVLEQYRSSRKEHSDNPEFKSRNRYEQSSTSEHSVLFEETLSGVTTVSEAIVKLEDLRSTVDMDAELEFSTVNLIEFYRFYDRLSELEDHHERSLRVHFASLSSSMDWSGYRIADTSSPCSEENSDDIHNQNPGEEMPCHQEEEILRCMRVAFGAGIEATIPGCVALGSFGGSFFGPAGAVGGCLAGAMIAASGAAIHTFWDCLGDGD